MSYENIPPQYLELAARFALDAVAMSILIFGLYYRRYRDKELVTAAAMFNIFAFAVLSILSMVNFTVAAGFGLFAILALFNLRSEQITKSEITYFFGSIAIAVICSVQGSTLAFASVIIALILVSAFIIDHPRILRSAGGVKIVLDKIDLHALSSPDAMRKELTARLGVDVISFQITRLDYINDLANINVFFRKP